MRTAEIKRKTAETDIVLKLNADGSGKSDINTGVGFLDHMLTLFSRHGRFDIELVCRGYRDMSRKVFLSGTWRYERNKKIRRYNTAYGRGAYIMRR